MRERLAEIETAVADGSYQPGGWQQLTRQIAQLPAIERRVLADDVSRVSRALHRRHGFAEVPFAIALPLELVLLAGGLFLLGLPNLLAVMAGAALLALCLQPLIKILTGLAVGVRYDYAYLWHFEPRFKMQYGTFLALEPGQKVAFHLAGGIGTPTALAVAAYALFPWATWLGWLAVAAALLALGMQVGAFAAEWWGVKKVGPFRLSLLTSPASAAYELKLAMNREGG